MKSGMSRYCPDSLIKKGQKTLFEGNFMIAFEGLEEPAYAMAVSLSNAKRIWNEV